MKPLVLLLLLLTTHAAAAACETLPLHLPGAWSAEQHDGLTRYHSLDQQGVVTVAAYQLGDAARGKELLARATTLAIEREKRLAGGKVRLSGVTTRDSGGATLSQYHGYEPASGRSFESVRLLHAGCLVSVYFEALEQRVDSAGALRDLGSGLRAGYGYGLSPLTGFLPLSTQ